VVGPVICRGGGFPFGHGNAASHDVAVVTTTQNSLKSLSEPELSADRGIIRLEVTDLAPSTSSLTAVRRHPGWRVKDDTTVYGGIELGGTNCNCAVGSSASGIVATARFDTGAEATATLARVVEWFHLQESRLDQGLTALGVASFGPLDLASGTITQTPKAGWGMTPLRQELGRELGCAVAVDTDVNCAALAEHALGAGIGSNVFLYLTVGTGIGVGAVVAGELIQGMSHPEMGHMRIPQRRDDSFVGSCPFHGNCWEGLASGQALANRYRMQAADIVDSRAWELEAEYLALGVTNLVCNFRPQRIAFGGGVFKRDGLLRNVAQKVSGLLTADYFAEAQEIERILVTPDLGWSSGVVGALLIAQQMMRTR
jgi:fructokinase